MFTDESDKRDEDEKKLDIREIHPCFQSRGNGEECRTCSMIILKKENATCEILLKYLEEKWNSRQKKWNDWQLEDTYSPGVFYQTVKLTIDAVKKQIQDAKRTFETPAFFMGYIKRIFHNKSIDMYRESGVITDKNINVDFHRKDFDRISDGRIDTAIENLYKSISKDLPSFTLNDYDQMKDKLESLNAILERPGFYDDLKKTFPNIQLNTEMEMLISETTEYRKPGQSFSNLKKWQKNKILMINRLLIEKTYALYCPKMRNYKKQDNISDEDLPDSRKEDPGASSNDERDKLWAMIEENIRQGRTPDWVRCLQQEYELKLKQEREYTLKLNSHEDITDSDLARIWGVSPETVRQRRSRAIKEVYRIPEARKYLESLLGTPKLIEKIGHVFPKGTVRKQDIRGWWHIAVETTRGIITVFLKNEQIPPDIRITKGMTLDNLKVKKIIKNKLYVELCNEN